MGVKKTKLEENRLNFEIDIWFQKIFDNVHMRLIKVEMGKEIKKHFQDDLAGKEINKKFQDYSASFSNSASRQASIFFCLIL
jgi:hypothetical protein